MSKNLDISKWHIIFGISKTNNMENFNLEVGEKFNYYSNGEFKGISVIVRRTKHSVFFQRINDKPFPYRQSLSDTIKDLRKGNYIRI